MEPQDHRINSTTAAAKASLFAIVIISSLLIALSAIPQARADTGHITLLTVSEGDSVGGTADLYLIIKPGDGNIYIDSFPLTKVDTQSSVRYANSIACDLLQKDCSQYDFFYTIRANSAIVGGPSAGGAMAVLTTAVLDGQSLDQHTAMTGTIDSGGIIGPVAGITEKVKGAKAAGIKRVLIPALTSNRDLSEAIVVNESDSVNATADDTNNTNTTIAPVIPQEPLKRGIVQELSDGRVEVVKVGTVEEALLLFTGKNYSVTLPQLQVPAEYTTRMIRISSDICNRTAELSAQVARAGMVYNDSHNYTQRIVALPQGHEYSKASLCFSENIELSALIVGNMTATQRDALATMLRAQTAQLDTETAKRNISTISDLETYAIVEERIIEARDLLKENGSASVSYAQERLLSARIWSEFFGMPGKQMALDDQYLRRACLAKISEADERINYVRLYAPLIVGESQSLLDEARHESGSQPILCIFTAGKAKAQANILASAISVGQENIDALLQQKLDADKTILEKQQEKGFFPILGYSYAAYASDLRKEVPYSALTFAEYSLELSNIDIYFPKPQQWHLPPAIKDAAKFFALGALFGIALTAFILGRARSKRAAKAMKMSSGKKSVRTSKRRP